MRVHVLKTWEGYYDAVESGVKPFELRFDDRGFETGDILELHETNPQSDEPTGRQSHYEVTYVLHGGREFPGLLEGWVIMGIKPVSAGGIYRMYFN